jgi:hypothetical protein
MGPGSPPHATPTPSRDTNHDLDLELGSYFKQAHRAAAQPLPVGSTPLSPHPKVGGDGVREDWHTPQAEIRPSPFPVHVWTPMPSTTNRSSKENEMTSNDDDRNKFGAMHIT